MADEVTVEINYDSGSDESDGEEVTTLKSSRDSNALLDSWLRELDSLTTVSTKFDYFFPLFLRNSIFSIITQ